MAWVEVLIFHRFQNIKHVVTSFQLHKLAASNGKQAIYLLDLVRLIPA